MRTSNLPLRTLVLASVFALLAGACAAGGDPVVDRAFVGPDDLGIEARSPEPGSTATATTSGTTTLDAPAASGDPTGDETDPATTGTPSTNTGSGGSSSSTSDGTSTTGTSTSGGTSAATSGGGGPAMGVTDDSIEIVYYWSASQTDNNPFLAAFPEANADERRLIETFVKYINNNDGRGTLYGQPIQLHGRKLALTVVDAGLYSEPEKNRAAAEQIAKELQPFLALSNGGVISTRICPILAAEDIITLGVLSYLPDLAGRTNGFCLPAMTPIERQADVSFDYIVNRLQHEPYINEVGQEVPRVFGITYGEWPEMVDMAPAFGERLRAAGVDVPVIAAGGEDLGPQQQQSPGIVAQFRQAGVNTVIMPEAVMPIAFTAAADAQSYQPDYYVWPCSGEDAATLVRFYSPKQWERASGLTCFDPAWAIDITDDRMERSEWMAQYRSEDTGTPAGAAPLVYNYLMPLVAGIARAGRDLNARSFIEGLRSMPAYRYDFIEGPTRDVTRHQVGPFRAGEMGVVHDFAYIEWDNNADQGQGLPGTYVFPEDGRRYGPGDFG